MEPSIGDKVLIYPVPHPEFPNRKIQWDGIIGRFLPDTGAEVIWSDWWHRRLRDGSIYIKQPTLLSSQEEDI